MKMTIIYNSADNVLTVFFSGRIDTCWIFVAKLLGPQCIWKIVNVLSAAEMCFSCDVKRPNVLDLFFVRKHFVAA